MGFNSAINFPPGGAVTKLCTKVSWEGRNKLIEVRMLLDRGVISG